MDVLVNSSIISTSDSLGRELNDGIRTIITEIEEQIYSGEEMREIDIFGEIGLGAISKGYALDNIAGYLERESILNAYISFESAMLALGNDRRGNLWQIAIPDPVEPERTAGVIEASDKFIAFASGIRDGGDLLSVVIITDAPTAAMAGELRERFKNNGAVTEALAHALLATDRQRAVDFYMSGAFDFEMILFYVSDDDPRGFEILHTNVSFSGR